MSVPLGTGFSTIDDCEDAWDEYLRVSVTADPSTDRMMGATSLKLGVGAGAPAGEIIAKGVVSTTIIGTGIWMWVKSSVALALGDFQLTFDDSAHPTTSPHELLDIPALTAATWTQVYMPFANPASGTSVVSLGLKMVVDKTCDIYLDDIKQATALTTYTLQTTIHPDGIPTVTYLISSFSGLTVPLYASLDMSGVITESVDMLPGEVNPGEVSMPFVEDYTTYPEGFWYKVLNGYAEIKIVLEESVGIFTTFFWGAALKPSSPFEEISLISGAIQRRGEITVVDLLIKLKNASVHDVVEMMKANQVTYNTSLPSGVSSDHYFVSLGNIIGCIMAVGFDTTYALRFVPFSTSTDIQFDRTGAGDWIDADDVLICLGSAFDGYFGYFNSTAIQYWGNKYPSPWELLSALIKNFGFVARRSSSALGIECIGRGKDYTVDTYSVPSESSFIPESIPGVFIVFANHENSSKNNDYTIAGRAWVIGGNLTIPTTTTQNLTESQQADISIPMIFFGSVPPGSATADPDQWLFADDGTFTGVLVSIQGSRHYDYNAAAYNSTEAELAANLVLYMYRRFAYQKRGYERSYAPIKQGATNSHTNCQLLRSTVINDGVSDRTFYAVETRKNLGDDSNSRLSVVWREV